jgi:hypothetical protein
MTSSAQECSYFAFLVSCILSHVSYFLDTSMHAAVLMRAVGATGRKMGLGKQCM